jgi:hypothetical protein
LVTVPPTGALWTHEPKLDGWRVQLAKAGPAIALYTRHGHDLASRARAFVQRAAAEIPEPRVLLDGELVALGDDGRADFHAVRRAPLSGFWVALAGSLRATMADGMSGQTGTRRATLLKKLHVVG